MISISVISNDNLIWSFHRIELIIMINDIHRLELG